MSKPVIDELKCIGCGTCNGIAPDVFTAPEDGVAFVKDLSDEELTKNEKKIKDAIASCPAQAISTK